MDDLTKPLIDFLGAHPNMSVLDISHSTAGKALFPLLQCLGSNTTLTSLDISGIYLLLIFVFCLMFISFLFFLIRYNFYLFLPSGNQVGDLGASILTDALGTNQHLTSLNIEQNGIQQQQEQKKEEKKKRDGEKEERD